MKRRGPAVAERGGPDGDAGPVLDLARRPRTPPRRSRPAGRGPATSCTASSVASGAARCAPETNRTARSQARPPAHRAPPRPPPRAPRAGQAGSDRPVPMRTGMVGDDTAARMPSRPSAPIVALFGPTGVGKTAVAVALADRLRSRGEEPVAVSADALQVYRGAGGAHGRRRRARSAPALEHRLVGILPVTETFSAGALRAGRARRDRRAARRGAPPARRRRHRPLPACRAGGARPAPAAAARRARALARRARGRGPGALHGASPGRARGRRADRADGRPAARPCARAARRGRGAAGRAPSCGRPRRGTHAAGGSGDGPRGARPAIDARVDAMVAAGRSRRSAAPTRPAPRRPPARRSASTSCCGATSRR